MRGLISHVRQVQIRKYSRAFCIKHSWTLSEVFKLFRSFSTIFNKPLHILSSLLVQPKWRPVRTMFIRVCLCYNTKTRLYSFDPLKPHFYTVKLGLQRCTLIFVLQLKNIDCGYLLEPPKFLQSMFWAEIWKLPDIFIRKFSFFFFFFFCGKILNIFE